MRVSEQKRIFNKWLSEHRGIIFKVVRVYSNTRHDNEDLFQEIAVQLWNSIPNFRNGCSETTWIYRVAFYSASSWAHKERRRRETREQLEQAQPFLNEGSSLHSERLDWLYEQIARLQEPDRSLALLLLDGFRYREIAEIVGLSESNVGVRICRIKKSLTQTLSQETTHEL